MNLDRILAAVQHHLSRTSDIDWDKAVWDPRKRRGRRWAFEELMEALWAGALTGATTLREVESLAERRGKRISDTTLWSLLTRLKPKGFETALVRGVREAWRAKELGPVLPLSQVAVDGKTIWTGKHKANRYCQLQEQEGVSRCYNMRMLRATAVSGLTQLCLGQAPIEASQNDMSAFPNFFAWLLKQYGRSDLMQVISLDAGFASKANMDLIAAAQRGYLIALKLPQQELHAEATRLLRHRRKPDAATPWEQVKGERIRRLLFRTEEMAGWKGWTHLRQAWRVRQETEHKGVLSVEERYFLTNLTVGATKGEVPLHMVRGHWGIENGNNWTMDVVWREDANPWTSRALEVVSLMRLLAMNVLIRLRTRRLRSEENRHRPWKNLLRLVEDVLVRPFRHPPAIGPPCPVQAPLPS